MTKEHLKGMSPRLLILVITLLCAPAFAQQFPDAGSGSTSGTLTGNGLPDPSNDPVAFIGLLVDAAQGGHWRLAAALLLIGLIYLLRRYGGRVPRLGPWMQTDRGGAIMALVMGVGGGLAAALFSGRPITIYLIVDAISVGLTAAGGWAIGKKILGSGEGSNGKLIPLRIADDPGPSNDPKPNPPHAVRIAHVLRRMASIAVLFFVSGCGPTLIDDARRALTLAEQVQTRSISALEQFDRDYQTRVTVEAIAAGHPEQAEAQLATYRTQRSDVVKVVLAAAAATAAGAALIPLVERGLRRDLDLEAWLRDILDVGLKLRTALITFGVGDIP